MSEDHEFKDMLSGGIEDVGDCFAKEVGSLAKGQLEEVYDTAVGELNKSLHGYLHSIISGDGIGTALVKAGIGCVVKVATQSEETSPLRVVNKSLPTVDDMLEGVQKGFGLGTETKEKVTLVKIKAKLT